MYNPFNFFMLKHKEKSNLVAKMFKVDKTFKILYNAYCH